MAKLVEVDRADASKPEHGHRPLEQLRHVSGGDADERAGQAGGPALARRRGGPPILAPLARQHPVETCCWAPVARWVEPRRVVALARLRPRPPRRRAGSGPRSDGPAPPTLAAGHGPRPPARGSRRDGR
eukprot:2041187-Pyramimonas_sp.AAC.1